MIFWEALEWLIVALFILFLITQVIIPAVRNLPLCPIFRRNRKLEKDISSAKEALEEAQLENEAREIRDRAEAERRKRQ